ncbi:hypothetical protein B0H16DRAFT_1687397 [Mycena metata]|uniref:Uncharacterized protein n=1 Tax=Mycena metata TaxID=1033252 RepID=A0AAD7JKG1_9AGAR|nr:hypothetical protein B0H16DRAFT_1687397 [Mycena metata]
MAAADLVCFQTHSYKRRFMTAVEFLLREEAGKRRGRGVLGRDGRTKLWDGAVESGRGGRGRGRGQGMDGVREAGAGRTRIRIHPARDRRRGHVAAVAHCPVGVDAERVRWDILRPGIQRKLAALCALYEGEKTIMRGDTLDVVKRVLSKGWDWETERNTDYLFTAPRVPEAAADVPAVGGECGAHSGVEAALRFSDENCVFLSAADAFLNLPQSHKLVFFLCRTGRRWLDTTKGQAAGTVGMNPTALLILM